MSEDFSGILFCSWPFSDLDMCAPTLHRRNYCYFISTLLIYVLECIYTIIYIIVVYF
jgi:hypothetical protein